MGGLPKKALRESQLLFKTAGSVVADGSHQTYKVSFIENGKTVEGFYKKLAPKKDYPALLAKMSVATSLFKRIFQGKRSAEERLVFDDQDRLVGTLSINVEGFKPFNLLTDPRPDDPITRELVIPTTKTLVEKNFMEIILGRWYLNDDDAHPQNNSLAGDIDFDMFWNWFTIYMKEPRAFIGVPNTRINLTTIDWERLPNVRDSKPYHWYPYQHPGQETIPTVIPMIQGEILKRALPKPYADPKQFEDLARSPEAQEQKFASALKVLLTFQPEMVHRRLEELFGDMSLNYTSLDETSVDLRIQYETNFPQFCNEQTNKKPFVDFMMALYQEHYDNLYRVVVFYMGCDNNGFGVPLPATYNNLYHKPSVYKNIVEWVKLQNETLHKNDDPALKHDLPELQKRYHQVWRDAFAPSLKEMLHKTFDLTMEVLEKTSAKNKTDLIKLIGKDTNDATLTRAWDIFGTLPELSDEKIIPLISVDQQNSYRVAIKLLVEFTNKLNAATKAYYEKERVNLTEEDNLIFCKTLNDLIGDYELKIRLNLANATTFAGKFNIIAVGLKQFSAQANFPLHLTTTDEQMKVAPSVINSKEVLPHTDNEVIQEYCKALFLWAGSLRPTEFNHCITEIIDGPYAGVFRSRGPTVKEYLNSSTDSCDIKLAYIFASGKDGGGALNSLLVKHLTSKMLTTQNLPSVNKAVKDESFYKNDNIANYTKSVVSFATMNSRLIHLYNLEGIKLFYQAMYAWIDKLPSADFNRIIESSLAEYEKGKSKWFSNGPNRRQEVQKYKYPSQARNVALIFLNGEPSSKLSRILFKKVIEAMQADLSKSSVMQSHPGNKLVKQFNINNEDLYNHYLEVLKAYAVEPSHEQVPAATATATSAAAATSTATSTATSVSAQGPSNTEEHVSAASAYSM